MAGKVLPWEAITARCQLTDSFRGKSGCLDPQALLRQIVSSHSFQTSYRLFPSISENGLFLFLLWQVIEYNWTTYLYNRMFNFTFPTLQCYTMMKKNGNRTMEYELPKEHMQHYYRNLQQEAPNRNIRCLLQHYSY